MIKFDTYNRQAHSQFFQHSRSTGSQDRANESKSGPDTILSAPTLPDSSWKNTKGQPLTFEDIDPETVQAARMSVKVQAIASTLITMPLGWAVGDWLFKIINTRADTNMTLDMPDYLLQRAHNNTVFRYRLGGAIAGAILSLVFYLYKRDRINQIASKPIPPS